MAQRTTSPSRATRWLLAAAVAAFYVLHQDWWNWRRAEPLVLGVLPIGLFYHIGYSVAAAGLMGLLVRLAWPEHLESADRDGSDRER